MDGLDPGGRSATGSAAAPPNKLTITLASADECVALGTRIGAILTGGDLVILSGPVGAGKTTLTRGLAAGLAVTGRVSSPTFVIARHHPAPADGPDLIHVDAYRLSGLAELDALDLDADLDRAVMVVEWGREQAEQLASSRLEIELIRTRGDPRSTGGPSPDRDGTPDANVDQRDVVISWHGEAWDRDRVAALRVSALSGRVVPR